MTMTNARRVSVKVWAPIAILFIIIATSKITTAVNARWYTSCVDNIEIITDHSAENTSKPPEDNVGTSTAATAPVISVSVSESTKQQTAQSDGLEMSKPNGCVFDKCEHDAFIYMLVPFRNRGQNLKRLAFTLTTDAVQARWSSLDCICLAVGNYDDEVTGMSASEALLEWKGSQNIVSLSGNFSRAGSLQSLLTDENKLITTAEDESLLFIVDTDMAMFPGFLDDLVTSTKPRLGYVPICYSVNDSKNWREGVWRDGGAGMFAAYASDLRRVLNNKFPGANKLTHGEEDWMIQHELRHNSVDYLNTTRHCSPGLWHLPHPHVSDWTATVDGMSAGPTVEGNGPYSDEAVAKLVAQIYVEKVFFNLPLSAPCRRLASQGTNWLGKYVQPRKNHNRRSRR
ncbi:hypothetical protein SARC_08849 [Sphaeroforma arctica JP610]|uniref:Hexosyltransferase n=1 Tax=Sphaeroforma arctica JP610 TaxID=667725 RepID=A0A0L0FQB3_9EUKA|nr:hypothetical protein SARC_08849 [Sphaeroforma arctica JP610]KNC78726.1 hypothetical protein SARC_08849 [Sphaeroforma arctica JP610]|eukprot:XP_014152628.1 hypothetical protein SARC_08849 [Sphaeroforma arctica JP610]